MIRDGSPDLSCQSSREIVDLVAALDPACQSAGYRRSMLRGQSIFDGRPRANLSVVLVVHIPQMRGEQTQ